MFHPHLSPLPSRERRQNDSSPVPVLHKNDIAFTHASFQGEFALELEHRFVHVVITKAIIRLISRRIPPFGEFELS